MANSFIVQQAVQMNIVGGNKVTAVFPIPLTANNPILVGIVAIDAGGAVGSDGDGSGRVSVTDTQGNGFHVSPAARVFGDRVDGYTILTGVCYASPLFGNGILPGGNDSVTFTFTPVSSAANCQVGLVAFELSDGGNNLAGLPSSNSFVPAAETTFPVGSNLNGQLNWEGQQGTLFLVCGGVFTNDGSQLSPGPAQDAGLTPAFAFGGVGGAALNGTKSTIAVQFSLSPHITSVGTSTAFFGNTPGASSIVSGAASGVSLALYNAPLAQQTPVLCSPAPGSYSSTQSVTLSSPGADTIYFTTDGSTPTTDSPVYGGPVTVGATETIKALAVKSGLTNSPISGATYTIAIVPTGGEYHLIQAMRIPARVENAPTLQNIRKLINSPAGRRK